MKELGFQMDWDRIFMRGFFFHPDGDGGSGTGNGGTGTGGAGDGAGGTGTRGEGAGGGTGNGGGGTGAGTGTGTGTGGTTPPAGKTLTDAEIEKIREDARKEGETNLKTKQANDKAKEEGRFKDLHETLEKRVKEELEPKAALADKLSTRVNTLIDSEIKDWPEAVKKTDPGTSNAETRMDWVERSRDLAKQLTETKTAPEGEHGNGSEVTKTAKDGANAFMKAKYGRKGGDGK